MSSRLNATFSLVCFGASRFAAPLPLSGREEGGTPRSEYSAARASPPAAAPPSFLLDDDILIDAGTGVGDLTLDEMSKIDHIFVSHSHLDHVLADSVSRRHASSSPIIVHALPQTHHNSPVAMTAYVLSFS